MPIQSRLQIAIAISGSALKRVQTLAGFACRIHASPSRPNAFATRRSPEPAPAPVVELSVVWSSLASRRSLLNDC